MLSRRLFCLVIPLFILATLATRILDLDRKVMHTDEAVNAYKTGSILEGQPFQYEARDFHGPVLAYSAWLYLRLLGIEHYPDIESRHLRLIPVIYGSLLIVWLLALYRLLPPKGLLFSAALFLISPALVYYSRYFIMETVLVFFYLGFIVAVLRLLAQPSLIWLYAGSVCLGLMFATKETAILLLAAVALAIIATVLQSPDRAFWMASFKAELRIRHAILAAITAVFVFAIVITAFGNQLGNLWAYLGGYGSYLQRGLQEGLHTKPWHYYGGLLLYSRIDGGPIWSEGLILVLGGIGAVYFIRQKDSGPTQLVRTGGRSTVQSS
jgi:uncharacterized protein (TIGR03663 family)